MHSKAPDAVKKLKKAWTEKGYQLTWKAEQNINNPETASYFVVYRFRKGEKITLENPANIVLTTRKAEYSMPYNKGLESYVYIVTAVDRFHNESKKSKAIKVKL